MSKPIDDGGPAFPESSSGPYRNGEIIPGRSGMSLRDWLASQASEDDIKTHRQHRQDTYGYTIFTESRERTKYRYADAMIAARKGGDP